MYCEPSTDPWDGCACNQQVSLSVVFVAFGAVLLLLLFLLLLFLLVLVLLFFNCHFLRGLFLIFLLGCCFCLFFPFLFVFIAIAVVLFCCCCCFVFFTLSNLDITVSCSLYRTAFLLAVAMFVTNYARRDLRSSLDSQPSPSPCPLPTRTTCQKDLRIDSLIFNTGY